MIKSNMMERNVHLFTTEFECQFHTMMICLVERILKTNQLDSNEMRQWLLFWGPSEDLFSSPLLHILLYLSLCKMGAFLLIGFTASPSSTVYKILLLLKKLMFLSKEMKFLSHLPVV